MSVSKTNSATESAQLATAAAGGNVTAAVRFFRALVDGVLMLFGVTLHAYTVATAPAAASNTGRIIYVSNGAAGNPCTAVSNGTNWLRSDTLAAIAAS